GIYGSQANGIAVDASGNAYVTGNAGPTLPTVNAFQPSPANSSGNPFVAKLNATGSALIYSTYLGGSGTDAAKGIAVDSSGNAYVTGRAVSTDFPTVNAFQSSLQQQNCTTVPCGDAFVSKVSAASGSAGTPLRITSFTPTSGPVGTTVTITGSDFTTATGI